MSGIKLAVEGYVAPEKKVVEKVEKPKRAYQRINDADVVRFASVGLSNATIAEALGCSAVTVMQRIKALDIPRVDARRSFMEDIFVGLTAEQQEWLADLMAHGEKNISEFVSDLIVAEFVRSGREDASVDEDEVEDEDEFADEDEDEVDED